MPIVPKPFIKSCVAATIILMVPRRAHMRRNVLPKVAQILCRY